MRRTCQFKVTKGQCIYKAGHAGNHFTESTYITWGQTFSLMTVFAVIFLVAWVAN